MTTDNIKNVDNSHFAKPGEEPTISEASLVWALKQIAQLEASDLEGFVFCAKVKGKNGNPPRGLEVICSTLTDALFLIEATIRKIDSVFAKHQESDE